MQEQWIQWKPIDNLASKYKLDSISDVIGEFSVIFSEINNEKNKLKIIFEESIDIHRITNEFLRKKILSELDEQYSEDFHKKWTFFKVKNSEYIKWISENSYGVWDSPLDTHFSFITNDLILDIIASYEPKIEFI